MAGHVWHLQDAWQADNPDPSGTPARITYAQYKDNKAGVRVIRIDLTTPTKDQVQAAITADLGFFDTFSGMHGTA